MIYGHQAFHLSSALIQYNLAQKWNGILPQVTTPGGMLLNLNADHLSK